MVNPPMENCFDPASFCPLQQSTVYAAALEALGARVEWFHIGCGRALVVERGRLRLVMRGPLWSRDADTLAKRAAVRQLARWPGVTVVTPGEPFRGFGLIPLVTPMHHAVWNLGPDMRAGMAGKWRNIVNRGERMGLQVLPGNPATLDHLIAAEALQRQIRRYRALPDRFTRALPLQSLRVWEWRQENRIEAAMAFIRHETSASYHLAWGSDVARKAGVHALMLTRAAEALAAEGVRWLDLGSVDSEAAPGLAAFKLGTGAELRPLGPTLLVLP